MPRPTGGDNYVGVEIECFGPLSKEAIRKKLNADAKLRGKFDVTYDPSIRPSPKPLEKDDLRLKQAKSKKILTRFNHRTTGYISTWELNKLKTIKGKEGLYQERSIIPYLYEEKYNGTKWVRVRGSKLVADERYLKGETTYNTKGWSYYNGLKQYYTNSTEGLSKYEVRLLVKQKDVNHIVKRVYDILNANGVRVNKSCGLHVHLDMRHRDKHVVYKNLYLCQDLFYKVHKARKHSRWCQKSTGNTYLRQQCKGGRYYCINTKSYDRHRTLEVRIGEATMDHEQVVAWIRMLCTIADKKSKLRDAITTTTQYLKKFKLGESNTKVIKKMQRAA